MSLDLPSTATNAVPAAFAPANHLLGLVQDVVASGNDTRIVLPGRGEITILPRRNEYRADVTDMAEFCRVAAGHFEVTTVNQAVITEAPVPARSIRDLLWLAAFHASQGLLVEGCSKYDVVQFRHWPNLTRLPATPNAARICALLTRHPTTIMLVHHILDIEKSEVHQIYSAAYSAGMAHRISSNPVSGSIDAFAAEARPEPVPERGLFRSLFAKLSGL